MIGQESLQVRRGVRLLDCEPSLALGLQGGMPGIADIGFGVGAAERQTKAPPQFRLRLLGQAVQVPKRHVAEIEGRQRHSGPSAGADQRQRILCPASPRRIVEVDLESVRPSSGLFEHLSWHCVDGQIPLVRDAAHQGFRIFHHAWIEVRTVQQVGDSAWRADALERVLQASIYVASGLLIRPSFSGRASSCSTFSDFRQELEAGGRRPRSAGGGAGGWRRPRSLPAAASCVGRPIWASRAGRRGAGRWRAGAACA